MGKWELYKESKGKEKISKEEIESYKYAEYRHKRNDESFNTFITIIKLPYYIFWKFPAWTIRKATFKDMREKQQKEIRRLKLVMESKERARLKMQEIDKEKYNKNFELIAFKDKLNNFPKLEDYKIDGDKETLVFKSNIALSDWINKKEQLETAINTNIIDFIQGNDKQIVTLETTKKEIPNYIEWVNDFLLDELDINLGMTALNKITVNLEAYTSGIVAGSIGSGKSVTLMCLVFQLLLKRKHKDMLIDINLFDGKGGLDWYCFENYLNSFDTVIENFMDTLDSIYKEYERRKLLFAKKAQKLSVWNKKFPNKRLPDIFIVIDEISVITDTQGMETEDKTIRKSITKKLADLARLGRAMGIHIIIGIQVPNMQTVPGQLKNVLDMRISGFLKDESASNIILQNNLASKLKHIKGRMILDTMEYQSYYINVENEKIFECIDKLENADIDRTKTIELEKRKKKSVKKDSNKATDADIDLTNK